tara:strand:+ start:294 stop:833 length:540 start_codon:yes stop_codon:yes gene_type:complete
MSQIFELKGTSPTLPESEDWWIAPGTYVIGNVVLAEGTSVWFGTTIRGDNETVVIGKNSNIQENSVLHTDLGYPIKIGKNCTIGHKAMLHGCIVDDNSLIGMCATVLNGAHIKKNCLVGANSLVTEGKTFPEGSLIMGSPAKVIRALTKDEISGITQSSEWYRENMNRFKRTLKPISLE